MDIKNVYERLTTICNGWFKHMFFSVTFVKKNGEVRKMLCKLRCKTWDGKPTTNGGSLNWNPTEKGYLHVIDCKIGKWRFVNFQTIQSIKFGGETFLFENFNHFHHFMLMIEKLLKIEEKKTIPLKKLIGLNFLPKREDKSRLIEREEWLKVIN